MHARYVWNQGVRQSLVGHQVVLNGGSQLG